MALAEKIESVRGQGLSQQEMVRRLAGDSHEPDWSLPITDSKDKRLVKYYNWATQTITQEVLHSSVQRYMKDAEYSFIELEQMKRAPIWCFLGATGKLARLINNGIVLPAPLMSYVKEKIRLILDKLPVITFVELNKILEKEAQKETIQDRLRRMAWTWLVDIEGEIDDAHYKFSMYDYLTEKKAEKPYIPHISRYYAELLKELYDAREKLDDYTVESYIHFTKRELYDKIIFVKSLIDDCYRSSPGIKTERKTKKKNKGKGNAKWAKTILKVKKRKNG